MMENDITWTGKMHLSFSRPKNCLNITLTRFILSFHHTKDKTIVRPW